MSDITSDKFAQIGEPIEVAGVLNKPILKKKLFANFNEQELEVVSRYASAHSIEEGKELYREGDEGEGICIIASGSLEVVKLGQATKQNKLIAEITPGMVIGEISLLDSQSYSASVISRTPVEVVALTKQGFDELESEQPAVACKLLRMAGSIMGRRLRLTTSHLMQYYEQTLSLATARDEARESVMKKSEYIAQVSHEIRNPLSAIIGYCDLLREEAEESSEGDLKKDLKSILSVSRHLNSLINDLLDLSKAEAGEMELFLERCDVSELANEVVNIIYPLMMKNRVEFNLEISDDVNEMNADVTRTSQILINLLSNAAKFTRDGNVTLSITKDSGQDMLVFMVKDNGIGMTPEQVESIFQQYKQASAETSKNFGGTGIGLSLSISLAKLMGGDIRVSSEQGKGSKFKFYLPINMKD